MPAGAVRVTLPPVQKVVGPVGVMVGDGAEVTLTFVAAEAALQPFGSVTLTVKLPAPVTSIDCVVAPVGGMVAAGAGLTVTDSGAEVALQLFASMTVTV